MSAKAFFKNRKIGTEASSFTGEFKAKLPEIKPEDHEDPCNVWDRQPSAYWTGRYMSLRDKIRNEKGFEKRDLIESDPPDWSTSEWATDYRIAMEIHNQLRKFCKTEEALESFWHYQQHFVARYDMPSLVGKFDPENDKPWIPRERLPVSATTTNVTAKRETPTRIPRAVQSVTNLMGKFKVDKKDAHDKQNGVDVKKENLKRPPWR